MGQTDALPPWIEDRPEGCRLALRVLPNASRTEFAGEAEGRLRIRLHAPPVDGKANRALADWLAEVFQIRSRQVSLLDGERSRSKSVLLEGQSALDILSKIPQADK